jgi:hypothetical protein
MGKNLLKKQGSKKDSVLQFEEEEKPREPVATHLFEIYEPKE